MSKNKLLAILNILVGSLGLFFEGGFWYILNFIVAAWLLVQD